jgi:hypothetical protein
MQQLEGFVVKGKENMVCKFQKSLYGLKQSPHEWNYKINAYFYLKCLKRALLIIMFILREFKKILM